MKKILKCIAGTIGGLFALAHVLMILLKLASGFKAGEFTVSVYSGHFAGFCIGAVVAALCFRQDKDSATVEARAIEQKSESNMTTELFWKIVEKTTGPRSCSEQWELIKRELHSLSRPDLVEFDKIRTQLYFDAYRWDLWGVAFIQLGGCSDDSFMDYRNWLVFQGKEVYEMGISDPDSLADFLAEWGEAAGAEGYGYLADQVYEERFDTEMPDFDLCHPGGEPKGERWDEDEVELRFPKVAKTVGELW